MVTVDLICDSEAEPRMRLLVRHMRRFDVRLKLHTSPPAVLSARVLCALSKRHPMPDLPEHVEPVAVVIDAHAISDLPDTPYRALIPNWPARSSDHEVYQLAQYLKTPLPSEQTPNSATFSLWRGLRIPTHFKFQIPIPWLVGLGCLLLIWTLAQINRPPVKHPDQSQNSVIDADLRGTEELVAAPPSAYPVRLAASGICLDRLLQGDLTVETCFSCPASRLLRSEADQGAAPAPSLASSP